MNRNHPLAAFGVWSAVFLAAGMTGSVAGAASSDKKHTPPIQAEKPLLGRLQAMDSALGDASSQALPVARPGPVIVLTPVPVPERTISIQAVRSPIKGWLWLFAGFLAGLIAGAVGMWFARQKDLEGAKDYSKSLELLAGEQQSLLRKSRATELQSSEATERLQRQLQEMEVSLIEKLEREQVLKQECRGLGILVQEASSQSTRASELEAMMHSAESVIATQQAALNALEAELKETLARLSAEEAKRNELSAQVELVHAEYLRRSNATSHEQADAVQQLEVFRSTVAAQEAQLTELSGELERMRQQRDGAIASVAPAAPVQAEKRTAKQKSAKASAQPAKPAKGKEDELKDWAGQERRDAYRLNCATTKRASAIRLLFKRSNGRFTPAPLKNLSLSGMCAAIPPSKIASNLLNLRLFLPKRKKPIDLAASVAWTDSGTSADGGMVGLAFRSLPNDQQQLLRSCLEEIETAQARS